MVEKKKTRQEKLQRLVIKVGIRLSKLGFIGFCVYFVIKAIMCAFFGVCII